MPERLLNGREVAEILHVSRSYAYLLMRRGDIPIVRMGKSVRVHPSALTEYIVAHGHNLPGQPVIPRYRARRRLC